MAVGLGRHLALAARAEHGRTWTQDVLCLNATWQLPVDELLALTDEFPARGLRGATSLFDRLFNQPAFVGRDGVWGPQLAGRFTHPSWTKAIVGGVPDSPVGHSIPVDNTLLRLLAGFQLSDTEFVELVAGLRSLKAIDYRPAGEGGDESIALSRASIGALYRHARLRRLLGCSIADFLRILGLARLAFGGSGPISAIASIDDVRCAVEFAAWQKSSGFTLDEIRYLIDPAIQGDPDPAALAAEIVASAKAEHDLDGILKHQLTSGPHGVHRDGCDLAHLPAWRQLRPQPLRANQEPGPDSRGRR